MSIIPKGWHIVSHADADFSKAKMFGDNWIEPDEELESGSKQQQDTERKIAEFTNTKDEPRDEE